MGKNINKNILIIGIILIVGILVNGCYNFNDLLAQGNITDLSNETDLNNSIVEKNETGEENLTVEFDKEILGRFNAGQVEVPVLVRLKDNSNININKNLTKEENIQILKQRDQWLSIKIDEVISTISNDEFRVEGKGISGFSGFITKKGLEKLSKDPRVKSILLAETGATATRQ